MTQPTDAADIVLVVDDEESVRRTVRDWLIESDQDLHVLTAADSGAALTLADKHSLDLAILDWNLGAGLNGLDLLQDLAEFQPNITAIMMTAYADQATPLDAMRKGVRDYLDKNQEFTREKLLDAVQRQLRFIRPAKRQRHFHQNLLAFRNAVEKALPQIEYQAALHDPVTLPDVIGTLFRFLLNTTRASDGVLFVRHYDPHKEPAETCRVFDKNGEALPSNLAPFPQSIAASAISLQEPCAMTELEQHGSSGAITLQPFEKERFSLLAAPLAVERGIHVVLELFDKKNPQGKIDKAGFNEMDVRVVRDAGDFGAEMLRQALSQRQTNRLLLEAVEAALRIGENVRHGSDPDDAPGEQPQTANPVLAQIRESLSGTASGPMEPAEGVRLAEAIRALAVRHGPSSVRHCLQLVESLAQLLDDVTGMENDDG